MSFPNCQRPGLRRQTQNSRLLALPTEILVHVTENLRWRDVLVVRQVAFRLCSPVILSMLIHHWIVGLQTALLCLASEGDMELAFPGASSPLHPKAARLNHEHINPLLQRT